MVFRPDVDPERPAPNLRGFGALRGSVNGTYDKWSGRRPGERLLRRLGVVVALDCHNVHYRMSGVGLVPVL